MTIYFATLQRDTTAHTDIFDITSDVQSHVEKSGLLDGLVTVGVAGSTASITTIEFESGVVHDLRRAIDRLAPAELDYEHDRRWGDGNGYSHVRAALLGPGECGMRNAECGMRNELSMPLRSLQTTDRPTCSWSWSCSCSMPGAGWSANG